MTNLIDIYEAGGAEVNEDRTMVTMTGERPLRPFDIILRVIPTGVEMMNDDTELVKVTFAVLVNDEHTFKTTPMGTQVIQHSCEETLTLPASQVRLMKEGE